jgi:hypothetical protein
MPHVSVPFSVRATSRFAALTTGHVLAFACLCGVVLSSAAAALEAKRWITYRSDGAGLVFDYPADVFSVVGADPTEGLKDRTTDRAGRSFTTVDGRASLQIAAVPNLDKVSVTQLRNMAVAASYKGAKLDYNRVAENWYVVSGTQGVSTFYERVQFSCNGRRLHIWSVIYPSAEGKDFEPMIDEMARRFRGSLTESRCN